MSDLNEKLVKDVSDAVSKLNKVIIELGKSYTTTISDIEKGNQSLIKNKTTVDNLKQSEDNLNLAIDIADNLKNAMVALEKDDVKHYQIQNHTPSILLFFKKAIFKNSLMKYTHTI